jgi:hypothetical protein
MMMISKIVKNNHVMDKNRQTATAGEFDRHIIKATASDILLF